MQRYNPKEIEPKWQAKWEADKIYQVTEDAHAQAKPKKYVLEYFPYPSGAAMHVGHVRNYTIGDAIARHARMSGYNVLHPMGWDGFGLPAENYAIKHKISPRQAIDENTKRFKQQLMQMGFSYDWSREIDSTDPAYYKWTQWFFLLLFKRGLAYQQESLQWWCPVDKTVLANEQVEAGLCWRCGNRVEKKALKQWFFKITDYADRLANDLDDVNWSDSIKAMQRNWIGRSKGAEIDFKIDGSDEKLTVFTTRPDTLFGATFMVVAPEHPVVKKITTKEQQVAAQEYIAQAQAKTDIQRQETDREKTGVFTGAYAVNPANGEKIPVWIADYVLYGYGTGAIMAVPAHDERDFEFAEKFELPIKPVVAPSFNGYYAEPTDRQVAIVLLHDPRQDKYCILRWKEGSERKDMGVDLPGGGLDEGETVAEGALREIAEETGYTDVKITDELPAAIAVYYRSDGNDRRAVKYVVRAELQSDAHNGLAHAEEYEKGMYDIEWLSREQLMAEPLADSIATVLNLAFDDPAYSGEGVMINSGEYDNLPTDTAREKIVTDLEKQGAGKEVINYKIRDWLISRQRYWGAPIPMVWIDAKTEALYDEVAKMLPYKAITKIEDGKEYTAIPVPASQLPVTLPEIDNYKPDGSGRSPLAKAKDWVEVWFNISTGETVSRSQPKPDGEYWVEGHRETDTMDGFACSSWYFLRFADPHNNKVAFDPEKVKFWLPVDDYIGGAEHAVMHLLYARMWTKVMQDEGLINFGEPFKTLRNHGMILAPNGQKMSKSKGNTIEPDGLIEQGYGADAIRIMELFIGPWNQAANWSVEGMGGAYRFLQRVWTVTQEFMAGAAGGDAKTDNKAGEALLRAAHRTIKKVDEDLRNLSFNTAIAALMEYVNELYKIKAEHGYSAAEWRFAVESLLQLLAPFAPHITEELWSQLGHEGSIHQSEWPAFDEQYLVEDTVTIVAQVNGKVRGNLRIAADAAEADIVAAAKQDDNVARHLEDKQIVKTISVAGKLVNFVVK